MKEEKISKTEIENIVKEIILNHKREKNVILSLESNLFLDLGLDSLDIVEIIMEIEDKFEIEISDNDFAKIKTFKNVIDKLYKNLNKVR